MHSVTHYEKMPRELIDLCLECKRPTCSGDCQTYSSYAKKFTEASPLARPGSGTGKRGRIPYEFKFRDGYITVPEMVEMLGVTKTSIYRHLKKGETMDEIYEFFRGQCEPESL